MFLNDNLVETVYMLQLPGYEDKTDVLVTTVIVWSQAGSSCLLYLLVYVDDILVMGSDSACVSSLVTKMGIEFKISHTRPPSFLKCVYMVDCKTLVTLVSLARVDESTTVSYADPTQYRSLARVLQYLTITRPDLSFAVNRLCQHMHAPTTAHWLMFKHVLRYVKGTLNLGLRIYWAGDQQCIVARSSTETEYKALADVFVEQCIVARSSTETEYKALADVFVEQCIVARSSTETEYKALADVFVEQCIVARSSTETEYKALVDVFVEHVEIDYHFVRDKVVKKELQVHFISMKEQLTDIFAKALSGSRFVLLQDKLNVDGLLLLNFVLEGEC
ncbi:uncharacterized protein LOC116012844 [Ipomoea triloba]|uniref:uncharacterized protein LOC116012844 n=1 Tax=Ipomoea triloba TaxID=35885 RepID=UPI00125D26D8|nr:uncharacterized protein LOC116012844 [Ipomoea triloba]